MNDLLRQTLCALVEREGPSLLDQPERLERLLRDHCRQYPREAVALVGALCEGVVAELRKPDGHTTREVVRARLSVELRTRLALEMKMACWAVDSWALALGLLRDSDLADVDKREPP